MLEKTKLRINVLGTLEVALADGRTVPLPRGCASLLALLVIQLGRPISREVIVDCFWPEAGAEQARAGLRQRLYLIRRALEHLGLSAEPYLLAGRDTIQLDIRHVTSDIEEFHRSLADAEHADSARQRIELLGRALALYGGDLAPGCYQDCFVEQQPQLAAKYRRAVVELIGLLRDTGNPAAAIDCARRALALDPTDEELHLTLMRLYAASGQPLAVARQFRTLCGMIENELGETVAPGLFAMATQLQELARSRFVSAGAMPVSTASDEDNRSTAVAVNHPWHESSDSRIRRTDRNRAASIRAGRPARPGSSRSVRSYRLDCRRAGSLLARTGLASGYRSSIRMPLSKDACLTPGV